MKKLLKQLKSGILDNNPVLIQLLGLCPTLAVTTSVLNALGMGVAATAVLICSNIAISALRKVIPDKVRIPCYIVLIAGFVTAVQMLLQAFAPDVYDMLGVYLALEGCPEVLESCLHHRGYSVCTPLRHSCHDFLFDIRYEFKDRTDLAD